MRSCMCVSWGWDLSRLVLILLHVLFVMEHLTNVTYSSWKRNLVSFGCLHCLCEGVIISLNNVEARKVTEWTDEMLKAHAFTTLSALWHNPMPDSEVYPSCQGMQFGGSKCRILWFVDRASRYNSCKWPTWRTILFFVYVYSKSVHVSSTRVLIIRRINFINTTSGICHSV